ncbi:MAG: MarR family transcriptional regulator [Caulobacteraceae bacterium]|nr:MarR family transcriptional regulator [Caulobacteraceae bacterium]
MTRDTNCHDDAQQVGEIPDLLRLDVQLCFALYSASNLVTRLYRPLLEPLGLTYPQYLTMLALWEFAPLTVSELGDKLGLDSGTLTPLLKRLEKAGLVSRRRDQADERRVRVHLTDEGQTLRDRAAAIPLALMCKLPIDPTAAKALKDTLSNFAEGLRG